MNIDPILAPRASSIIYGLAQAQLENGRSHWLLPANICRLVPLALFAAKASIEFIDIDPITWCMDTRMASARLADSSHPVTAVLYVRTYGISDPAAVDLRTLRAAASPATLLIDDRCCDIPILDAGELGPNLADVVLFSTGKGKIADLGGGGFGYFLSRGGYRPYSGLYDASLLGSLDRLCDQGGEEGTLQDRRRVISNCAWLGGAAPGSWLDYREAISHRLGDVLPHKARLNAVYRDALGFLHPRGDGQMWRFNVEVIDRDALLDAIFAAGLFASAHYPPSAEAFAGGHHKATQKLTSRILNLFNGFEFDIARAQALAAIIIRHYGIGMRDGLRKDME